MREFGAIISINVKQANGRAKRDTHLGGVLQHDGGRDLCDGDNQDPQRRTGAVSAVCGWLAQSSSDVRCCVSRVCPSVLAAAVLTWEARTQNGSDSSLGSQKRDPFSHLLKVMWLPVARAYEPRDRQTALRLLRSAHARAQPGVTENG